MSRFLLAGIIIGASLLAYVVSRIDISIIANELARASAVDVVLSIVALAAAFAVKAVRWSQLLPKDRDPGVLRLLYPVLVGNAGNAIIPHSGEFLRSAMLNRQWGIRYTTTLTSIAAERMFDFLSVGVVSLAIFFNGDLSGPMASALRFIAVGFATLLAIFIVLLWKPEACSRMVGGLTRMFPQRIRATVEREFAAAVETLRELQQSHLLVRIVALSLLQWLLIGTSIYLCIHAVGSTAPVAVAAGVLLLTVAGLTLPTAPGYVGTIQICFLLGMAGFGSEDEAIAASVIYNFVVTIPVILPSLPAFMSMGFWRKRGDA